MAAPRSYITGFLPKPKKRSRMRRWAGREWFILRRRWNWHFSGIRYATHISPDLLPEQASDHHTPTMRKLKDVDMWLQENKVRNLKLALPNLNGLILRPGETFSYWRLIGNPSKRRGYVEGMVLDQGSFKPGTGGGLCQLSNLIFWISIHTPLTVTERWRHSFDVFPDAGRTQPFGSGATCAYNYIDLQLRNDTDQLFQLQLWLTETHLHGAWRSERPLPYRYEVFEADHRFESQLWGGYTRHNRICRHVYDRLSGEQLRTEDLVENHAIMMYNPMLPENTPNQQPDPSSTGEERS